MRAALVARPESDAFIAGYNIHHLFTGALFSVVFAIPLLLADHPGWRGEALVAGFGVSTAMVLDEVVYLIATDGSNKAYLTAISWVGALILIAIVCSYAVVVAFLASRKGNRRKSC